MRSNFVGIGFGIGKSRGALLFESKYKFELVSNLLFG